MQRGFTTTPDRILKAEKDCDTRLMFIIKEKMKTQGISSYKIAACVHLNPDTFNQKTRHGERFKMPELRTLFRVLKFSDEEILKCMKVEP